MSQETAGTSQSSEKPKKKKKYLYLDKFEAHVEKNSQEHAEMRKAIRANRIITGIILLTVAALYWVIRTL